MTCYVQFHLVLVFSSTKRRSLIWSMVDWSMVVSIHPKSMLSFVWQTRLNKHYTFYFPKRLFPTFRDQDTSALLFKDRMYQSELQWIECTLTVNNLALRLFCAWYSANTTAHTHKIGQPWLRLIHILLGFCSYNWNVCVNEAIIFYRFPHPCSLFPFSIWHLTGSDVTEGPR